jgi:hypothetical protein
MSEYEEALVVLKRMEQNQLKSLEVQAEQLALVRSQMERSEARVQESIALHKVAVTGQRRALNLVLPVILVALVYVGYVLFKHT